VSYLWISSIVSIDSVNWIDIGCEESAILDMTTLTNFDEAEKNNSKQTLIQIPHEMKKEESRVSHEHGN